MKYVSDHYRVGKRLFFTRGSSAKSPPSSFSKYHIAQSPLPSKKCNSLGPDELMHSHAMRLRLFDGGDEAIVFELVTWRRPHEYLTPSDPKRLMLARQRTQHKALTDALV